MNWFKKLLGVKEVESTPEPEVRITLDKKPNVKAKAPRTNYSTPTRSRRDLDRLARADMRKKNDEMLRKLEGLTDQMAKKRFDEAVDGILSPDFLPGPSDAEIEQAKLDLLSAAEELS